MAQRARKPQVQQIPGQVQQQAPEAAQAAPQQVKPAAAAGAQVIAHPAILVTDGEKQVDAAKAPVIHPSDVLSSGMTLRNLALNLLAGTLDPALFNRDADCWKVRSIKNEKSAFFKLIEKDAKEVRQVWEKAQAQAKRKTQVSLQALGKLFKVARGGVPPITKMKQDIMAIIGRDDLKDKKKLAMIAEICDLDGGE